jgi:hypothetical protein
MNEFGRSETLSGSLWKRLLLNAVAGGSYLFMAGWTGLEPATSGLTGQRSNRLNYHPMQNSTAFGLQGNS